MRKVFWCSLAGGIVVLGGVFAVAFYATQNPQTFAGRAILTAGRVVTGTNPVAMLDAGISRLQMGEVASAEEAAPVGGEEPAEPAEERAVSGAIVIPDADAGRLVPEIERDFDELVRAGDDAAECPAGGAECPPSMPRCDEEDCERLHMPCSEADSEEQEEAGVGPTGAVEKLIRRFEKSVKRSAGGAIEPAVPVGQSPDGHPYHRESGCPYTGHGSMYCPSAPLPQPGAEEASEPTEPEQHSSALRAIRRFSARGADEVVPTGAAIDTMEYRVSDGQLYDFGPGSL